ISPRKIRVELWISPTEKPGNSPRRRKLFRRKQNQRNRPHQQAHRRLDAALRLPLRRAAPLVHLAPSSKSTVSWSRRSYGRLFLRIESLSKAYASSASAPFLEYLPVWGVPFVPAEISFNMA